MIYGNVTGRHIERRPGLALPTRTSRFVTFGFASRRRPFLLFRPKLPNILCARIDRTDLSCSRSSDRRISIVESCIEIRGSGSRSFLRGAVKHGPRNTQARSQDFSQTPRHICGLADILRTRVRAGAWRSVSRVNYRYRRTKIPLRPKFNRRPDLRRF